MSRTMKNIAFLVPMLLAIIAGCSKDSSNPGNTGIETGPPEILSLTAEKTQILYGGQDPAVITCAATGGNLTYVWEVDLGDIIPLNTDRSKVRFTGSACCVGEKIIKCTVSNSKGSVSKTIIITILEELKQPEIITVQSSKASLSAAAGESAALVCYAIGGQLKYQWRSDCGAVAVDPADNSKATFPATAGCIGTRSVTCTVSNEKGTDTKSIQIVIEQ